jgi:cyclic-di-AMP phosphodiesterase PgpH
MNRFFSFIRNSHSFIYKAFLFIIVIGVIVYAFPQEIKFKYEINNLKGKPWNNENLLAPFDFAIRKSAEEITAEKTEILKNRKLYFRFEKAVYTLSISKFRNSIPEDASSKARIISLGTDLLDSVFQKGIIQMDPSIEGKPADYIIYIIEDNEEMERELGSFFTIRKAVDYLTNSIRSYPIKEKDLLLQLLENALSQNVILDAKTTEKVQDQAVNNISSTKGAVATGEKIIAKGEIVTPEKFAILESLKYEYEVQSRGPGNYLYILLGEIIIVMLCLSILIIFLVLFRKDIFLDNTRLSFILFMIMLMVLMAKFSLQVEGVSIFILPFCILPIIVRAFYDTRVAMFTHLVSILIISFLAANRFEFVFIELIAGMVAIFSIVNMRNRSQIFISAIIIFSIYSAAYFSLVIIQEGRMDSIRWRDFVWFGISALLTLFTYPLIFVFERVFGFISDVSLLELSDTNSELLRELASKAPGTFQHSLQVANLAEEAIYKIGGNALLVRTGALYHDIGKMDLPMFFIENQAAGVNPHDELNFEESAAIIIGHVINGIEKAREHNIPEQVIDFIRTHHGTTVTAYFYRAFQNNFPGERVNESKFRYPGPIPYSKETAVLMMADSVEAASRSLKSYDAESIDQLVERIIDAQINQRQFVNSDITFKDITIIKKILKKKLMNIYHVRIDYPR